MSKTLAVNLLLLSSALCGCAAHKKLASDHVGEVVVPRACMTDIKLTDTSECRYKAGEPVMTCKGLELIKLKKCPLEFVEVKSKTEKRNREKVPD